MQLLTARADGFEPVPRADNAFWRDSIPVAMRASYIRYGEQYAGRPWTTLPWTVFAENKLTGNRVNYEQLCFEKRRRLAALVMAEVMEGEGRFMPDIIDGLGAFCEETWWGIPAHYNKPVPRTEQQEVDLFNAETASLVAWTAYMLKARLDAFAPEVCQRVGQELKRRMLDPALTKNYWWKTAGMNWNPWISSNWLACVLLSEQDEARRQQAISEIEKSLQAFVDAYPDDGGCDEGPGYWDRAAASLFEAVSLLQTAGCGDVPYREKMGRMGAYIYKVYIGNGYCVNFADAHDNKALLQTNIVYPFGRYMNDRTMCRLAAYIGRQQGIADNPAALYDRSGNWPTLGRELLFLRHINDFLREVPQEPQLADVWLPDLQVMTARRGPLFVAMKGGHNDESHNHNDVGSFVVYADGEPLLIDVGVGEYTAKTFGRNRYDIWTMQSQYHNLPLVNGVGQKAGRQYAAKVVGYGKGRLTLDIAGAYPEEAAVASWRRTVAAKKQCVEVTEDYRLTSCKQPTQLVLMTTCEPVVERDGAIRLGHRRLAYDAQALHASVEPLDQLMDSLLRGVWGDKMFRILLTVKGLKTKNQIKYNIR
jgi:hypothetical protein